mgnify:CR=1 FL=1
MLGLDLETNSMGNANEKSDLRRFKCFHNGIILIVICFNL